MRQKLYSAYVWLGKALYVVTTPLRWLVLQRTLRGYVVVEHDARILLVNNWLSKGEWSLPGGGIHRWERAETGVRRELREEVGIDIPGSKLEFLKEGFKKETIGGKHFMLFRVAYSSEPKLHIRKREISNYMWVPVTALSSMNNLSYEVNLALRDI